MTNGEKIKVAFPHYDIEIDEHKGYVRVFYEDFYTTYPLRWWDAEYKEPTTKNDLVTLTFSKGTLKYSCKDYVVYKKDWLRSHYGAEIDIMFGDSQYKEPTTKNDLGVEDCVSRVEVLKLMKNNWHIHNGDWAMQESIDDIIALPSVTPIRPKGHWFIDERPESNRETICSNCEQPIIKYHKLDFDYRPSFCPNCGADMRNNIKHKGKPIEGNNESYNCENWIP